MTNASDRKVLEKVASPYIECQAGLVKNLKIYIFTFVTLCLRFESSAVPKEFDTMKDRQSFVGQAEDSSAGATLIAGRFTYYIEGLHFWPDSVRTKKVRVIGSFKKKKIPNLASPTKVHGTQQTPGTRLVIDHPIWALEEIVPTHPGFIVNIEFPGAKETKSFIKDIPIDHQFVFFKNGKEAKVLEQADTVVPILSVEVHFSEDHKRILEITEFGSKGQSLRRNYGTR